MNRIPPQYPPADYYEQPAQIPEIHLMDYVQIIQQRLPLVVVIFTAVALLGTAYTWTRHPRYTAKARLLIEPGQVNLTDIKGAIDPVSAAIGKREFIQTQVELIKSRPVAETVIQRLELLTKDDFRNAKDPVARFQSLIKATPERNTHLINVEIEREDRSEAQVMVNALVNAFIDDVRSRRLGVSEEGLEQLRKREQTLRERLDASTDALQKFMIENDMVSFEKSQNMVMDRLVDLNRQFNALQPKRMQLQARVEAAQAAIKAGEDIATLPDIIDAPVIRSMKLELSNLSNEYSQMVERLGEKHPNLLAATTQIQALQTKMRMEADAIIRSIQLQFDQVVAEETLLNQAIKQQEQEVYRFNHLAAEYEKLRRIQEAIAGPYTIISRRIEEIDINRIGGQGENIFVVGKAAIPVVPSWPNKKKNMMIIVLFGGALAVGVCFFLDYMDTTIKAENDVRRLLGSKVLAGIPNVSHKGEMVKNADLVAFENPRSHAAEAFRTLRAALAFSIPGERISSIVVSSTLPSEGKSLSAISIAITHAQTGKRTILIDADMRKPRLHDVFNVKTKVGLSTLLSSPDTDISQAIHATAVPSLDFIPCGAIPKNPAELIDSKAFTNLVAKLKETYDFIVFDSPPGFSLVDSMVIAKHTDGIILIIKSFQTPKAAADQFATRLREAGARLLGVVLNTMDAPRVGYYYGGYYHAGGKRYAKYYRHEDVPTA